MCRVMKGHQSSMTPVMMMAMMMVMMKRMAIVTKWDANEGVNTMDKGCGCAAKTCFDDSSERRGGSTPPPSPVPCQIVW